MYAMVCLNTIQITCGTWPKIKAYIHGRSSNRSRQVQLNTASNGILSLSLCAPKYWALCGSVIFWFIISRALWCCGLFLCVSFFRVLYASKFLVFLSFDSLDLSSEPILFIFCAFHIVSHIYTWVRHDLNLLTCAICTFVHLSLVVNETWELSWV